MLFQSSTYLMFLPGCAIAFWLLPSKWRIHFLVIASYLFYASWNVSYAAMMFGIVLFNWYATSAATTFRRRQRPIVICAIAVDLAVLAVFKYSGFLLQNVSWLIGFLGSTPQTVNSLDLVLPLGISFFTFEYVHYLVDIRRGAIPPRSFSQFHLFCAFFPTQIAGPIKRFQEFLPQIDANKTLALPMLSEGFAMIIQGLFKKMALADNLAPIANAGFASPASLTCIDAWAAVVAFSFQIYFDFSGYTDIARGSALLFGFRIPRNFHHPYLARNPSDFWDRWHISLSRWLRDYLFIPLGGSRVGRLATTRNLMITMLLGGLWHGAAWHFVVWGAYWGILLGLYHQWQAVSPRFPKCKTPGINILRVAFMMVAILVGWCFFRSSITDAFQIIAIMARPSLHHNVISTGRLLYVFAVTCGYYGWVLACERWATQLRQVPVALQGLAYAGLLVAAVISQPSSYQPFIYFQF